MGEERLLLGEEALLMGEETLLRGNIVSSSGVGQSQHWVWVGLVQPPIAEMPPNGGGTCGPLDC
jgi:hypothetical protein